MVIDYLVNFIYTFVNFRKKKDVVASKLTDAEIMREKQKKAEERKMKEEEEEEKKEVKPKKTKVDLDKVDNHTLGFSGGPGVLKDKKLAKKKGK